MRWMLALWLGIGLTAVGRAQPGGDEAAVRRLDSDYVRAFLASDVPRFRELLADDFTCVLADGRTLDKGQFLQMAASPPRVQGFRAGLASVRLYGDTAVAIGSAAYRRPDGGTTVTRYTEVDVRRDGRWRMVSVQFTRVAAP